MRETVAGYCYCCKCASGCVCCPGGAPKSWSLVVPALSGVGSSATCSCNASLASRTFELKYTGSCTWDSEPDTGCTYFWRLTCASGFWNLRGMNGDTVVLQYRVSTALFSCNSGGTLPLDGSFTQVCTDISSQQLTQIVIPAPWAVGCGSDSSSSSSSTVTVDCTGCCGGNPPEKWLVTWGPNTGTPEDCCDWSEGDTLVMTYDPEQSIGRCTWTGTLVCTWSVLPYDIGMILYCLPYPGGSQWVLEDSDGYTFRGTTLTFDCGGYTFENLAPFEGYTTVAPCWPTSAVVTPL